MRLLRCVIASVLVAVCLLSASPASAQLAPAPTYAEQGFACVKNPYGPGGTVSLFWPSLTSSGFSPTFVYVGVPEPTYFNAELYRYNAVTKQWVYVAQRPAAATSDPLTWYRGQSNMNGPLTPYLGPDNQLYRFSYKGSAAVANPQFAVSQNGSYMVYQYYRWQSGWSGGVWATERYGDGLQLKFGKKTGRMYCTF